jgi:hypothetical protein
VDGHVGALEVKEVGEVEEVKDKRLAFLKWVYTVERGVPLLLLLPLLPYFLYLMGTVQIQKELAGPRTLKKAGTCGYKSIVAGHGAAATA